MGDMGLEASFDIPQVAAMALREKQIQQVYRPIIGIHKWFARRPGSLFRSLLLSEYGSGDLSQSYFDSNNLKGRIADPFMGGGTTIYEASRLGLDVVGVDINPVAYWLVRQALDPIDLNVFRAAGEQIWTKLRQELGALYETICLTCQSSAPVKYFIWAKSCPCPHCSEPVDLVPGYKVAGASRHPRKVWHCRHCRGLHESNSKTPECPVSGQPLDESPVTRGVATCPSCAGEFSVLDAQAHDDASPLLLAIEYRCPDCYGLAPGRQFKAPDPADLRRVEAAQARLQALDDNIRSWIPTEAVPHGDESDRLHRWGMTHYRHLFNDRQLLGLATLASIIGQWPDTRVREALATVFSDFLRYQNMLCRYDTYALKCQDIFSVHGFPVGLISCENSLPGIKGHGSGSFIHFVAKYERAKQYAQAPHEVRGKGRDKQKVPLVDESIELQLQPIPSDTGSYITCGASQDLDLPPESLDGVFTDPPYFSNVQYSELIDFCYVWLRKFLTEHDAFQPNTTRSATEITGNVTQGRGLTDFASGLSEVFCSMSKALKPGAPFVFTYHHNDPQVYAPIILAVLDAGLYCTTVLPAPAEMSASMHIAGTSSSIIDSVLVCRKAVRPDDDSNQLLLPSMRLDQLVDSDINSLNESGYEPTEGDIRCMRTGHAAGLVAQDLFDSWSTTIALEERMGKIHQAMIDLLGAAT